VGNEKFRHFSDKQKSFSILKAIAMTGCWFFFHRSGPAANQQYGVIVNNSPVTSSLTIPNYLNHERRLLRQCGRYGNQYDDHRGVPSN